MQFGSLGIPALPMIEAGTLRALFHQVCNIRLCHQLHDFQDFQDFPA